MKLEAVSDLLQRYQDGTCSVDERNLVEYWYDRLLETGDLHLSSGERMAMNFKTATSKSYFSNLFGSLF